MKNQKSSIPYTLSLAIVLLNLGFTTLSAADLRLGSPFWTDDYEAYLDWRQERIWQEIRRVTGLKQADDLEADQQE